MELDQQPEKRDENLEYYDKHGMRHPHGFVKINDSDSPAVCDLKEEYNEIHADRVIELNKISKELRDLEDELRDTTDPDEREALSKEKENILNEQSEQTDSLSLSKFDLENFVAETIKQERDANEKE